MSGRLNVSHDDVDGGDGSVTSSVTRSDAGLYTCVVKNIAGHVSHNISLFIEGLCHVVHTTSTSYRRRVLSFNTTLKQETPTPSLPLLFVTSNLTTVTLCTSVSFP